MTIRIVTDSSSDITWDFAEKNNIIIVPLTIIYNEQTHKEDKEYDFEAHYKKYEEEKDFLPKTSQPTPKDFYLAFEKLIKDGATAIIVTCISSKLSGTMNSANVAKKMILEKQKDVKIAIIDSKNASYAQGFLIEEALTMIEEEKKIEEIQRRLEELVHYIKSYLYIPTLRYLFKGGRISLTKYLIARLLRRKVVVKTGVDGSLQPVGAVGNEEDGIEKIMEKIAENRNLQPRKIAVVYATNEELKEKAVKEIKKKYPKIALREVQTRAAITAHVGPGAIAIVADYGIE